MRSPASRLSLASSLALLMVATACTSTLPVSSGTPGATASGSAPSRSSAPGSPVSEPPAGPVDFPLAVVTGYTNLEAGITLAALRAKRGVIAPCDLDQSTFEDFSRPPRCLPADEIADFVATHRKRIALLPPGLVEPGTKVLPLDGADLFGGPKARRHAYPLIGHAIGLPAAWTSYERREIRTLISLGDSCPDRGPAYQAITQGKGWDWVFGGGRARYLRVRPNPAPPGTVGNGYNIVDAEFAGDPGAVARLVRDADITLDDFECPVVRNFRVHDGTIFSIDPRVLPHLKHDYGVDAVTLAANHQFDQGTAGFLESLSHFDAMGIPRAGAGADLHEALAPAVVTRRGLRFAFVGFNQVIGSVAAGRGQPGVAWLTTSNVRRAVRRARAAADVVICIPQWWGGDVPGPSGGMEYTLAFRGDMRHWQDTFFAAGCDQVLGHGTHWSGPIDFSADANGVHVTMVSHGNFLFGQDWSQETQEGVIMELAFNGSDVTY